MEREDGVDLLKVFQSDSVRAPSRIHSRMCLIPFFILQITNSKIYKIPKSLAYSCQLGRQIFVVILIATYAMDDYEQATIQDR